MTTDSAREWLAREFAFSPVRLKDCIRLAVAGCLMLTIAMYANFPWAKWGVLYVIIILATPQQHTVGGILGSLGAQFTGVALGGTIGVALIAISAQQHIAFALLFGAAIFVTNYMAMGPFHPNLFNLMRTTIIVIAGLQLTTNPEVGLFALMRLFQCLLGVSMAFIVAYVLWPVRAQDELDHEILKTLRECQNLIHHGLSSREGGQEHNGDSKQPMGFSWQSLIRQISLLPQAMREGTLTKPTGVVYEKLALLLQQLSSIARSIGETPRIEFKLPDEADAAFERVDSCLRGVFEAMRSEASGRHAPVKSLDELACAVKKLQDEFPSYRTRLVETGHSPEEIVRLGSLIFTLQKVAQCLREISLAIHELRSDSKRGATSEEPSRLHLEAFSIDLLQIDPGRVTESLKVAISVVLALIISWGLQWDYPIFAIVWAYFIGLAGGRSLESKRAVAIAIAASVIIGAVIAALITVFAFPNMGRLPGLLAVFSVIFVAGGYLSCWGGKLTRVCYFLLIFLDLALIQLGTSSEKSINLTYIWDFFTAAMLGIGLGLATHSIMWPTRASDLLRDRIAQAFGLLSKAYGKWSLSDRDHPDEPVVTKGDLLTYYTNLNEQLRFCSEAAKDPSCPSLNSSSGMELVLLQQRLVDSIFASVEVQSHLPLSAGGAVLNRFSKLDSAIAQALSSTAQNMREPNETADSVADLNRALENVDLRLSQLDYAVKDEGPEQGVNVFQVACYRKKIVAENIRRFAQTLCSTMADDASPNATPESKSPCDSDSEQEPTSAKALEGQKA